MLHLSPQEIEAAAILSRRFSPAGTAPVLLHRSEGILLEITCDGQPVVLKIGTSPTDASDAVQARLDWVAHLRAKGLGVPRLLHSTEGKSVETVRLEDIHYSGYAYAKIPLRSRSEIDYGDPAVPPRLGAAMGRMHRLARAYRPTPGRPVIDQWDEAPWLQQPEAVLHPSQAAIAEATVRLHDQIARLPRNAANYGLIHDDLHTGNVFSQDGDLAIIDFDLCHYSWFAADIASTLLFRIWIGPDRERQEVKDAALDFLRGLMRGYRAENDPPPDWVDMLPHFLKLREISLYQSFYRDLDAAAGLRDDEMFAFLYDSIGQNRPFLDVDFAGAT